MYTGDQCDGRGVTAADGTSSWRASDDGLIISCSRYNIVYIVHDDTQRLLQYYGTLNIVCTSVNHEKKILQFKHNILKPIKTCTPAASHAKHKYVSTTAI